MSSMLFALPRCVFDMLRQTTQHLCSLHVLSSYSLALFQCVLVTMAWSIRRRWASAFSIGVPTLLIVNCVILVIRVENVSFAAWECNCLRCRDRIFS